MAVSSVGLRLKCDCSGKAQKQLYSKLQTRFLVREDALIAKRRNCQTKEEEQDKIWSRVPKGGPIPRRTGRLTVGRKKNSNSTVALVRELTIPTERPPLVGVLPTFTDRGCSVISATDPYGRILGFIDRSRYSLL
jgi:hypothetical protein